MIDFPLKHLIFSLGPILSEPVQHCRREIPGMPGPAKRGHRRLPSQSGVAQVPLLRVRRGLAEERADPVHEVQRARPGPDLLDVGIGGGQETIICGPVKGGLRDDDGDGQRRCTLCGIVIANVLAT